MCEHLDFAARVEVNRLVDCERFAADVRINCAVCGMAFRFLGLPGGLQLEGAAVSVDGTEARLAIHPVGEELKPIHGPTGFSSPYDLLHVGDLHPYAQSSSSLGSSTLAGGTALQTNATATWGIGSSQGDVKLS